MSLTISDRQDVEFDCKFCEKKKFKSSGQFMNHLSTSHVSVEGGSYICRYGENNICSACPGVGVSQVDYTNHVTRHHINRDKVVFNPNNDFWNVLSSSVNLPAVLNNPAKGKQKDFFTRSWGADFVDTAILPASGNICEIPANTFDRYLRKLRKHYVRHKAAGPGLHNTSLSSTSSRETTPSPSPESNKSSSSSLLKPRTPPPAVKLNIPSIFLDQNFDLTNPNTFNAVFPFLNETLSQSNRSNPFQVESKEAAQVEGGGRLVQERLQHYIDQVEVNIASQVCTKSHHFFQVMTYHDALMSQLLSLISVVRTVRERLGHVQEGVVSAMRVPQLAVRRSNLESLLSVLGTIETLHKTQPTIQLQLSRQEFAAALELIATSKDIVSTETAGLDCLRQLPGKLDELTVEIEKTLLSDFQLVVSSELEREKSLCRVEEVDEAGEDCQYDECVLAAIVSGLCRQNSYKFLEFFEQQSISAVKNVIKDVVLSVLDISQDTTLTNLVADFASRATSDGWTQLVDLMVGSCLRLVTGRVKSIYQLICSSSEMCDTSLVDTVMINICDQMQERLGKLLSVRNKAGGLGLVTPSELVNIGQLVSKMVNTAEELCRGRHSSSLQLSHTTTTIMFVQQRGDQVRAGLVNTMETEKWRRGTISSSLLLSLHPCIRDSFNLSSHSDKDGEVGVVMSAVDGESFVFVQSVMTLLTSISEYCKLADQIPQVKMSRLCLLIILLSTGQH